MEVTKRRSDYKGEEHRKAYNRRWAASQPKKTMLHGAKYRAIKRGLEFSITYDDFEIPDFCPILGIRLVVHSEGKSGFFDDSPSLDRIDNRVGYVPGNVRVISCRANMLKSNGTPEEFELILQDLRNNARNDGH